MYASDTGTGSFQHLCMDLCQTEYDRCEDVYKRQVLVVIMVVYWLLQTKEWFPDTWLNPFIIQDNTGTVLLQFGVVILAGLALSRFFNTKTAKGAMKDNEAGK